MDSITITKIPGINALLIKQEGTAFFVSTQNSLLISTSQLSRLLKHLIVLGFLSPRVLEGVLEEVNTSPPSPLEKECKC